MQTITLEGDSAEQLADLAKITGKSIGECLKDAIQQYLESVEEHQDAEDAQKIWEEYQRNPGKPFTLEDAMARYGLSHDGLSP
ncbi:MAG: CopG family transcriptional regulator [Magnetococcales bacterium]|nr:CopG family transcriptional regulator [Magnetococcales bacterium]NGZ27241.1 CopG family transcriptional regulator [Magnetococcales bacterium]